MFPGNDSSFGGFPSDPFAGRGAGSPPPADAIFESAFEELDGSSIEDELLAAAALQDEKQHAFLSVGLHFFEHLKAM
jgi:hypothetical protein